MKPFKTLKIAGLALVLAAPAGAATVDSFQIDTASEIGTNSTFSFVAGTEYTISVSGTFIIDSGRTADAEYFDIQTGSPRDTSGGFDIGVQIDNTDIDWGPFSATSTYDFVSDALDGIINLRLAEASPGAYLDNVGFLSVEVTTADIVDPPASVPLPASAFLLLAGVGALSSMRRKSK